jgi:hypothetical protein
MILLVLLAGEDMAGDGEGEFLHEGEEKHIMLAMEMLVE